LALGCDVVVEVEDVLRVVAALDLPYTVVVGAVGGSNASSAWSSPR
jgi:hypothetical protein